MGRPPTNTKLRLLETAHELIWRNSYGSVSVDGICEKANVKKGSFYHYFPSKADLAMASIDWWMTNTIPFLDDIFSPSRHPINRFTLLIDFIYEKQEDMRIEFGQVCGCPFITIGSELAAQDEIIGAKISAITQQKMTYYQNALRDMIAMGLIDEKTNVELKAEEIYAFITGNMMLARIKNDLKFMKTSLKPSLMNLIGVELSVEDLKKLTI